MSPEEKSEADAQLERRTIELVDRYAGSLKRSTGENKMRTDLREKVEEMGRSKKAYQHAVMLARSMTKYEAEQYLDDLAWFAKLLLGRQLELFPEEAAAVEKRAAKKAAEAAAGGRTQAELDAQTDASQRSDPNAGGAKPAVDNEEQKAGEDVLKSMAPATEAAKATGKKSQSTIAKEKLNAAMSPGASVN